MTLLVGANASGKSTVIQSLLLLRQSYQAGLLQQGQLQLNGLLANVGTMLDAFSQTPTDLELSFRITEEDIAHTFSFDFQDERASSYTMEGQHPGFLTDTSLFRTEFNYMNAERVGPRPLYPIPTQNRWKYDIGIRGEYALHVLAQYRLDPVANALAPLISVANDLAPVITEERRAPLFEQTRQWMQEIIPNFDLKVTQLTEADQVQAVFGNIPGQALVRPTNIGFGLIYTLPIVVAALVCLSSEF